MRVALLLALSGCAGISDNPGGGEELAAVDQPGDIALVGEDLYFVGGPDRGSTDYYLFHLSTTAGGEPDVVAHTGVIEALTADESGAYWIVTDAGYTSVMGYPRGASAPVELFHNPNGWLHGSTYRNVVVDSDSVYYSDQDGRVWKTPKAGGTTVQLAMTDTSAGAVALSPDGVWVTTLRGAKLLPAGPDLDLGRDEFPDSIVWGGGALFVAYSGTGLADGTLLRATLDDGPKNVATRLVLPGNLTAYNGYVYLTTGNLDSAVRRTPFDGGGSQPLAQGNWPAGIAVDDTYVYFSDSYNDRVRRVPH